MVGTDTNVGKTYVGCLIVQALRKRGHRVGVYKPVASGVGEDEQWEQSDPYLLWQAAGRMASVHLVCPQNFRAPLAPPAAAEAEGKSVDGALLRDGLSAWEPLCDLVLVEGVGGWFAPVSDSDLVCDLATEFGYPVVVVAANRLGVINHTLLTVQAVHHAGLHVLGVILNDPFQADRQDLSTRSNYRYLARFCNAPILGQVHHGQTELPDHLTDRLLKRWEQAEDSAVLGGGA
ncbi:MAG: ATP-dependent dethiobiotin synthetase BioD [Pirellulaceae bacterium]|nr:MAG: ATP-dependent dethiobiotin synthetase BioD [Pirellulaceae bacterium]